MVDLRDIIALAGMALAGYGAYVIEPAAAMVAVGAMLFAVAIGVMR